MPSARRWQQGVSIVEVMVALTLGLVAVGGAAAVYLANRKSFATVESVARLEENARFAMDLLSREIREAGNSVCGGALITTNVVAGASNWAIWDRGLVGDVLASSAVPGLTIAAPTSATAQISGTNSLLVWSGSVASTSFQITGHNLANKQITTRDNTGYKVNDVVVACDGSQLLSFELASDAVNNTLTYSDTAAASPQLSSGGGAFLTALTSHVWYVGKSNTQAGSTALRRLTINKNGTWGSDNDEMVTGVTGLQIRYLLANTAGVPTGADYQDAAAVAGQWALVSAVRLTLTMQTLDNAGSTGSASTVITHDVPMTASIKVRVQ